ncbi:MAG: multidrug resistance efflux pump [Myxococcota bacterium]|jgi:multidrug resistance efflux pump
MSSSEMEEGFRMEMAEYVREEKELKAKLGVIEHNLEKPMQKLLKAKAIVEKAKAAYAQMLAEVKPLHSDKVLLEGELELLSEKKSKLRTEAMRARGGPGMRAGTTAFVEQMEELGGDAATAEMKEAIKDADAEAALAALKKKMGE